MTKKILVITTLLILLSSTIYATLTPNAYAAEASAQQKAITILNDVVDLETDTYVVNLNKEITSTHEGCHQNEVNFNLNSSKGSLRVMCTFIDNKLRQIYLNDYTGKLALNQPITNTVDKAKDFLQRYQTYTTDSFYGELKATLSDVAINKNATKTVGNIKLEISVLGDQTHQDLIWTYVDENGIQAKLKNVALSFDRGQLQCFMDNWNLYTIAGTPKLSDEYAKAIALNAIQNFTYSASDEKGNSIIVSGFKVSSIGDATLSYLNYEKETSGYSARGDDSFILYPSWYVPIGFDKLNPGSVTGARVRIWADTGEVSTIDPMIYSGGALSYDVSVVETANIGSTFVIPFMIIMVSSAVGVCAISIKTSVLGKKRLLKTGLLKTSILLLCILVLSSLMLSTVSTVSATKKAEVYASLYGQAGNEPYYAQVVTNHIQSCYQSAGVTVANNYGIGTYRAAIIANIDSDELNYDCITVFHFGHMAGANNYYDNSGYIVFSEDIAMYTSNNKHYFVWLWACNQANGPTVGMPPAWTETSMTGNALLTPDGSGHYFIGFYGASPALSDRSFRYYAQLAYPFIMYFYTYAVTQGYNVSDSLFLASYAVFNNNYYQCPLNAGFETWWPGGLGQNEGWFWGWMRTYGDGYVYP